GRDGGGAPVLQVVGVGDHGERPLPVGGHGFELISHARHPRRRSPGLSGAAAYVASGDKGGWRVDEVVRAAGWSASPRTSPRVTRGGRRVSDVMEVVRAAGLSVPSRTFARARRGAASGRGGGGDPGG